MRRYAAGVDFRSGVLVGLVISFVAVLGAALSGRLERGPPTRAYAASVVVDGARLTAQGGRAVALWHSDETIRIACRDVCDDYRIDDGDALYGGYEAQVLDAQGACLFCRWTDGPLKGGLQTSTLANGALVMRTNSARD